MVNIMIAGIGIDIVEHERIKRIHDRYGEKLARCILDDLVKEDIKMPHQVLAKGSLPGRQLLQRCAQAFPAE